jgi:hypothetical protein
MVFSTVMLWRESDASEEHTVSIFTVKRESQARKQQMQAAS